MKRPPAALETRKRTVALGNPTLQQNITTMTTKTQNSNPRNQMEFSNPRYKIQENQIEFSIIITHTKPKHNKPMNFHHIQDKNIMIKS
jgi:hypothetical protein